MSSGVFRVQSRKPPLTKKKKDTKHFLTLTKKHLSKSLSKTFGKIIFGGVVRKKCNFLLGCHPVVVDINQTFKHVGGRFMVQGYFACSGLGQLN